MSQQIQACPCFIVSSDPVIGPEQAFFTPFDTLVHDSHADNNNVTVVSIIGTCPNAKAQLANYLIDHPAFTPFEKTDKWKHYFIQNVHKWSSQLAGIEIFYDKPHSTIYLNIESFLDDENLLGLCNSLDRIPICPGDEHGGNTCADILFQRLQKVDLKMLLYAFLVSHLVIILEPQPKLNIKWLRLLREISVYKQALFSNLGSGTQAPLFPHLPEASILALANSFRANPTLAIVYDATIILNSLILYQSSIDRLQHTRNSSTMTTRPKKNRGKVEKSSTIPLYSSQMNSVSPCILPASEQYEVSLVEIQKVLEQQTKLLFKRSKNESLYHLLFHLDTPQVAHVVLLGDTYQKMMLNIVSMDHHIFKSKHNQFEIDPSQDFWLNGQDPIRMNEIKDTRCGKLNNVLLTFRNYILQNLRSLHAVDSSNGSKLSPIANPGEKSSKHVLHTARNWLELSQATLNFLCSSHAESIYTEISAPSISPDYQFSNECCQWALDAAREVYFTNLPKMYSTKFHHARTQLMIKVFRSLSRGPASSALESMLIQECLTHWHSGHQRCDARSLTNHPCIHPAHGLPVPNPMTSLDSKKIPLVSVNTTSIPSPCNVTDATISSLSNIDRSINFASLLVTPHLSNIKLQKACSCGQTWNIQDDPFDLITIHPTFYLHSPCCSNLISLLAIQLAKKNSPEYETIAPLDFADETESDSHFSKFLTTPAELGWDILILGPYDQLVLTSSNGYKTLRMMTNILSGYNMLLPWPLQLSKLGYKSSIGINTLIFQKKMSCSKVAYNTDQMEEQGNDFLAHFGIQYECPMGHAWLLSTELFSQLALQHGLEDPCRHLNGNSLLGNVDLPIYMVCICGMSIAQLQRIYYYSASSPKLDTIRITFKPLIRIYSQLPPHQKTPKYITLGLGLYEPICLPHGQLICIRLPYIYSLKGKPLIQGKMTNNYECKYYLQARAFEVI